MHSGETGTSGIGARAVPVGSTGTVAGVRTTAVIGTAAGFAVVAWRIRS